MTGLDFIDLEVGASSGLHGATWVLTALGFTTLLWSAAPAVLKVLLLGALGFACAACVLRRPRRDTVTHLRLSADGSAILYTATGALAATLSDNGWCSRWCCIAPFVDTLGRRRFRCLVCRSRNPADSYRRLLVHLRLAGAGQEPRGLLT